jgi:hypothetical protein
VIAPQWSHSSAPTSDLARLFRIIAIAMLLVPVGGIGLIGGAELIGGEITGLFELMMAVPLLILAWIAWRHPFIGGSVLVAGSIVLSVLWVYSQRNRFDDWVAHVDFYLIGASFLFIPALIAGVLLLVSARLQDERGNRAS